MFWLSRNQAHRSPGNFCCPHSLPLQGQFSCCKVLHFILHDNDGILSMSQMKRHQAGM